MDLACWRNEEGYVIRLWGSERVLSYDEWCYLRMLMQAIDDGKDEALGEGYIELCKHNAQQAIDRKVGRETNSIDLAALGLIKQREPIKRRF